MTLPVTCPPSSSSDSLASTPRKRRRRAPAGGAADDCFACVKRNTKCDRRRPYCSQCLEFGKECSGYRTHLTWGVGVASRGKLRGLSLPVAKSAPAPRSPIQNARPRSASTLPSRGPYEHEVKVKDELSSMPVTPVHQSTQALRAYDLQATMIDNTATASPMPDWNMRYFPGFPTQEALPQQQHQHQPQSRPHPQPHVPPHLQVQRQAPQQQSWSNTQRSMPPTQQLPMYSTDQYSSMIASNSYGSARSFPESVYAQSPSSQSFSDEMAFQPSSLPMYNSYSSTSSSTHHSPAQSMMIERPAPTSHPDLFYAQSDVSSSMQSNQGFYDMGQHQHHQNVPGPGGSFYDDETLMGRSLDIGAGGAYALDLWMDKLDASEGNDEDVDWLDSPLPMDEDMGGSLLEKLSSFPNQFLPYAYLLGSRGSL